MEENNTGTIFCSWHPTEPQWFYPKSKKQKCKWLNRLLDMASTQYFNGDKSDLDYSMIEVEVNKDGNLDIYIEVPEKFKKQYPKDYVLFLGNVPKETLPSEMNFKFY